MVWLGEGGSKVLRAIVLCNAIAYGCGFLFLNFCVSTFLVSGGEAKRLSELEGNCTCAWPTSTYLCTESGHSYGCDEGYCWGQCSLLKCCGAKVWCWIGEKDGDKNWATCTTHSDCANAMDVGRYMCYSACTVYRE